VEFLAGRLTDHVSVGLLAAAVPRVVIDDAVAEFGKGAKRSDAKLAAQVMVYFAMAMALFADEDCQEVLTRLAEVLTDWGRWDAGWECPGSGGITQARERLGADVVREVFERVAQPVAGMLARGAWLAGGRMVSIDGFEWDVPDSEAKMRVVEYEVPDRGTDGERELFCLPTTLLDARCAPAALLAAGYHERWEHEQANAQAKTVPRGPGKVMRSQSPDMVLQELYGYLLTHYAINSLICQAATEADIDPDRVEFTNAVRVIRRRIDDPAAFSP